MKETRTDRMPGHRSEYERNRKKILASQSICGICGKPVDKSLKPPDPMSACVDHIIPVSKGGHPSDINNLQLAHMSCNRAKSDKLFQNEGKKEAIGNRNLPKSMDWTKYHPRNFIDI